MKGAVVNEKRSSQFQDTRYNKINKEERGERFGGVDRVDETQMLFHHFLGD